MNNPLVSVVIPAYNEEEDIGNCLSSLQKQSYKKDRMEIIVVDDGSKDKTPGIIKRFNKVKLIKGQHKGPGFSRNLGASKAKGEILIFVDADMTFDKDYIKNLIKPILFEGETASEEGVQIASNQNNIWSQCWGQYFKIDKGREYGSAPRAIIREEFIKLGGFDPSLGYEDDKTFAIKYGLRAKWVHDAICYHKNPSTLKEVYKQSVWIGSSLRRYGLSNQFLRFIAIPIGVLVSPLAILILSLRKCYKLKRIDLLLPWMFIFITTRYFGTIGGLFKKTFLKNNVR